MVEEYNNNNESKSEFDGIYVCDSKRGNLSGFGKKRSIAERRGFNSNPVRINTALFRAATTTTPLTSPIARSPHLTIPPGISPTALLDSPIMLPNSQALLSPTTGTFLLLPPQTDEGGSMFTSTRQEGMNMDMDIDACDFLKFKSQANIDDLNPIPPCSASKNLVSSNCHSVEGEHIDNQIVVQGQPPLDFSFPEDFPKCYSAKNTGIHLYNDLKLINNGIANAYNVEMPISQSEEASDESTLPENSIHGEDIGRQLVLEGEQKETAHKTGVVRTSEDGYNWRKYGQKQVKGSEYPRSYYKCTQPNCLVTKKVERSLDGHITEIIYKGSHNHAIPHPNRRASALSADEMTETAEANGTCNKVNADSLWGAIQTGVKDIKHGMESKADGQERTSLTSVVTEISDLMSTRKTDDTPEHSSALASHDGDEDGAYQALTTPEDEAEDDEPESKRRKKESYGAEPIMPTRAVREPRVVVQIESEVDILDDGYRWRKYGQKVVKGNPNPRSYYKCTSAGCPVRKHVERASHDLKFVLTTYEGKHNHEVPTAKNSNQISSNDGGLSTGGANGQVALALHGSASIPKSETLAPHLDRKPDFSNDFLRSRLIGSFGNDMKFGPSSISQMKYPSLDNTMPYGSYGMNTNRCAAPQPGSIASMFPEFPMPLPLNLPSSGNFALGGMNFNSVKPMCPVQSYLSGQQVKEIDIGFLRPKQEQKDDTLYSACIPSLDHASASLTPPSATPNIYQSVMQNFP